MSQTALNEEDVEEREMKASPGPRRGGASMHSVNTVHVSLVRRKHREMEKNKYINKNKKEDLHK